MIGYIKCFDSNKTMSFKVSDNKLLKKYNKIWGKTSNIMNIEFDSDRIYVDNDKYIKTKTEMYEDRVYTTFHGKKVSIKNASYKRLSLIVLDSVIRVIKGYYPQILLQECKYIIKGTKPKCCFNDDLDLSSSDESDNESDSDSDSETANDESSEEFLKDSKCFNNNKN